MQSMTSYPETVTLDLMHGLTADLSCRITCDRDSGTVLEHGDNNNTFWQDQGCAIIYDC